MSEQKKAMIPTPPPQQPIGRPIGGLDGSNPRGETAACPTGLGDAEQQVVPQRAGGGGAPGTGTADPSVPPSPGEGVTEEQVQRSGLDDPA
jgi:hypothetical protein